MRVKTNVKAGIITMNHNQAVKGLRVRSSVRAGIITPNHNQTVKGLRVKSSVKAGIVTVNHSQAVARGLAVKKAVQAFALLVCALVFAVVAAPESTVAAAAGPARAVQLDPGYHDVYQRDGLQNEMKLVAQIFAPERTADETTYVEHWVLFADYVYPNRSLSLVTEIRPSRDRYASLEDFLARVPWGPGFRYIRATAFESDSLPTGR